jgi:hypothetical protein
VGIRAAQPAPRLPSPVRPHTRTHTGVRQPAHRPSHSTPPRFPVCTVQATPVIRRGCVCVTEGHPGCVLSILPVLASGGEDTGSRRPTSGRPLLGYSVHRALDSHPWLPSSLVLHSTKRPQEPTKSPPSINSAVNQSVITPVQGQESQTRYVMITSEGR